MKNLFRTLLISLMFVNINIVTAATYYSKLGSSVPTVLTNWTTGTDGTGTSPANFTTANDVFIVQASHTYTSTASWTLGTAINLVQLMVDGSFNASNQNFYS